jgi:hypothetical protein
MPVGVTANTSFAMRAASGAAIVLLAATGCGSSHHAASGRSVQIALDPPVATLKQPVSIQVSGIAGSAVEARLAGATDLSGNRLPWTTLTRAGDSWRGTLPAPSLLGIYLVQVRAGQGAGARILGSRRWLLRVFTRGTLSRRSYPIPGQVARAWVAALPGHAVVVAMRRWRRPTFDHRDGRLHQLFVIAYARSGDTAVADRLGMFVTAVRDGFAGRWRLLQAADQP